MSYFRYLPAIVYKELAAPNILMRAGFTAQALKMGEIYHPYIIDEGDRPETIADLYYGDVTKDWLVKIANNIIDEASQWPLTQEQLDIHVSTKYASLSYALSTIDHYKLKTTLTDITSAAYDALTTSCKKYWYQDGTNYKFIRKSLTITPGTWNNYVSGEKAYWQSVTIYDKEFAANEEKRSIRLIDNRYAGYYETALRDILLNNVR